MFALFDKLFADKVLIDRLYSKENIEVTFNTQLIELIGDKELEAIKLKNTKSEQEFVLATKGVFIAIGQKADNKRYENLVTLDEKGFILVNEKMETHTKGLYAIGDCTKKEVKQVQTACNDGAIAAFNIIKYLG
jgi:thioredoxin reductase (NADPH)